METISLEKAGLVLIATIFLSCNPPQAPVNNANAADSVSAIKSDKLSVRRPDTLNKKPDSLRRQSIDSVSK